MVQKLLKGENNMKKYGTWFENSITQVTLVCNWPHNNNLVSLVHRAAATGILNFFLLFLLAAFQKQLFGAETIQGRKLYEEIRYMIWKLQNPSDISV